MTIKVFEGFAGVGSQRMALRDLGLQHEVVATSDWDYHATLSYNAIHTDNPIDYANGIDDRSIIEYLFKLKISSNGKEPMTMKQIARLSKKREVYSAFKNTNNLGSITEIDPKDIPDHDMFTYSFPCQDISVSGKGKGLAKGGGTRSGLLWECEKVIETKKQKYLLMENVKNLVGKKHKENFDKWCDWLETQGYTNYWQVLNAKDYGVPQNRERVFMVSILGDHEPLDFPQPIELTARLKDILEEEVEEKFYIKDEVARKLMEKSNNPQAVMQDKSMLGLDGYVRGYDVYSPTITAREYKEPRLVQVGQLFNTDSFGGNPQAGRVYDADGVSSTLNTMQGGNRQPKIIERIGNVNPSGNGMGGEVYGENGLAPTITTNKGEGPKVLVANGIYTNDSPEFHRGSLEGMSRTIKANNHDAGVTDGYRIRKLTPLECWRLMDFSDEDFYKAQAVCSNSQLYKQAGNSIVKAVLMAIFSQMFDVKRDKGKRTVAVRLDGDS